MTPTLCCSPATLPPPPPALLLPPPAPHPPLPQREVTGKTRGAFVLQMSGKIKESDQRGVEGSRKGVRRRSEM